MAAILFAVEANQSRSPPVNSERLLNCFIERQPPEAKSPAPIFGRPGLTVFGHLGAIGQNLNNSRGSWNFQGLAYFVAGNSLFSLTEGGVATQLGTGIGGSGPVSMSDNGVQLCIVNGPGGGGWIYTLASNVFQAITDPNFYPSYTVTFMDGYFIFERAGTNEFFLSALYDGTSFNGLDFASAEAEPGFLIATKQNLQLLFLFCTDHIELWYDSGSEDFPFQRYAGGVINYGTLSPYSIVKQDGAMFFLGADGVFYRLQANVPIRVSTHAIETLVAAEEKAAGLAGVFSMTFTLEGHKFIFLTLPATLRTLVFDISSGKWHEWGSFQQGVWRGSCCLEIYGQTLVGDAFHSRVGFIDWTNYMEYDQPLEKIAQSVTQHHDRKWLFVYNFELDMETGETPLGTNPQIVLAVSRDGGKTFGSPSKWRSMGMTGQYERRLRWLSMGRGRQWVFQVRSLAPVPFVLIAAHANIQVGST